MKLSLCLIAALLALPFAGAAAFACPEINGTFTSKDGSLSRTVQLYTDSNAEQIRYRLGTSAGFVPADGETHTIATDGGRAGVVKISCDDNSVTISGQENGSSGVTLKVTKLSSKKILVSSELTAANGVYVKERD